MAARDQRLLALDMGGVVMSDPIPDLLDLLGERSETQTRDAVWSRYFQLHLDLWSGRLSEPDFWAAMLGFAGLEDAGDEMRAFVIDGISPLPGVAQRLEGWSRQANLWALSNHRSVWIMPVLERTGIGGYFDKLLISDATGKVKPDSATDAEKADAFADLVERWPGTADQILYVDDKQVNLDLAAVHGIPGLLAPGGEEWLDDVERWLANGKP